MNTRLSLVSLITGLSILVILGMLLITRPLTSAQQSERCFPETGHCIDERIREYWEQNGGLPVFGYPITPQRPEAIEGQPIEAQWFERNRLELHPENQPPYDVLLGRLGVDVLAQQGRDWQHFPTAEPEGTCRYFVATRHFVCDAFLEYWQSNGLELDGQPGFTEAENLALFGLPLSDMRLETLHDGQQYQVQWFERARFEWHPEQEPPYQVQLGLLGSELRSEPTTQRIALTLFRSEKSDVYLIHVDGTGLVNLTNDPIGAGAGGPSWSPDGQRIAFSSSRGGNSDIYTIHPDGSNLVQLTTSEQDEVAPRWSPDGKYMLFQVRVRPNAPYAQQYDIFVMATDGSNTSQIASGVNPVWSPDSRRILYENPTSRDGIIHIINADGTDNRDLVNGFAPSWSPDSTRIAFQHRDQIYTVDPNGSDIELIADGSSPDWSPDGTTIAFVPSSPEGRTISVMDPDGTNKRALTEHGDHLHPRWSPDGHYITFTRGTTFGMDGGALLVMNADGSNEVSLAFIGRVPQFTWEP